MEQVFTISNNCENLDIIKKSKFISLCYNVQNKGQVDNILSTLQKEHKDATHICYAYSLISGEQKFSDDGEPQGTAGMPILNCIKKQNLKNVLVVVVRYFGGIKLGAGGLTRAYTNGASAVLKLAEKRLVINVEKYILTIESNEVNKLERLNNFEAVYSISFNFNVPIQAQIILYSGRLMEVEKLISSYLNKSIKLNFIENLTI